MKRSPLQRRKPPKRHRVPQDVWELVMRRTGGLCGCGCGRRATELHHAFPKHKWPELADHPDCLVAVHRLCHANHEAASRRLPRRAVRHAVVLADGDTAMVDYLARTYPLRSPS